MFVHVPMCDSLCVDCRYLLCNGNFVYQHAT